MMIAYWLLTAGGTLKLSLFTIRPAFVPSTLLFFAC